MLGLTATATSETVLSVSQHLDIDGQANAVIRQGMIPDNLQLSVSCDSDREKVQYLSYRIVIVVVIVLVLAVFGSPWLMCTSMKYLHIPAKGTFQGFWPVHAKNGLSFSGLDCKVG